MAEKFTRVELNANPVGILSLELKKKIKNKYIHAHSELIAKMCYNGFFGQDLNPTESQKNVNRGLIGKIISSARQINLFNERPAMADKKKFIRGKPFLYRDFTPLEVKKSQEVWRYILDNNLTETILKEYKRLTEAYSKLPAVTTPASEVEPITSTGNNVQITIPFSDDTLRSKPDDIQNWSLDKLKDLETRIPEIKRLLMQFADGLIATGTSASITQSNASLIRIPTLSFTKDSREEKFVKLIGYLLKTSLQTKTQLLENGNVDITKVDDTISDSFFINMFLVLLDRGIVQESTGNTHKKYFFKPGRFERQITAFLLKKDLENADPAGKVQIQQSIDEFLVNIKESQKKVNDKLSEPGITDESRTELRAEQQSLESEINYFDLKVNPTKANKKYTPFIVPLINRTKGYSEKNVPANLVSIEKLLKKYEEETSETPESVSREDALSSLKESASLAIVKTSDEIKSLSIERLLPDLSSLDENNLSGLISDINNDEHLVLQSLLRVKEQRLAAIATLNKQKLDLDKVGKLKMYPTELIVLGNLELAIQKLEVAYAKIKSLKDKIFGFENTDQGIEQNELLRKKYSNIVLVLESLARQLLERTGNQQILKTPAFDILASITQMLEQGEGADTIEKYLKEKGIKIN